MAKVFSVGSEVSLQEARQRLATARPLVQRIVKAYERYTELTSGRQLTLKLTEAHPPEGAPEAAAPAPPDAVPAVEPAAAAEAH